MSEYQYYDFRVIDRALTKSEMADLRSISTRAVITSTSFTNHYEWGELKADPLKLLEKYFDAFLYLANYGTRAFYFRLPEELIDFKLLTKILPGESVLVKRAGKSVIIGFENDIEDGEWDDGTGWMGSLIPLRSDLLRGDLRCTYLGWLLCLQNEHLDDDEPEPPVPPGLWELPAPLTAMIEFLGIDEDLVAVAATASLPSAGTTREQLSAYIRRLPETEKNELLVRAATETGERWKNELLRRLQQQNPSLASPLSTAVLRRNAGDLWKAAHARGEEKTRRMDAQRAAEAARQKAEKEANRARYLDKLATREDAAWKQISAHIQQRQPAEYDKAVSLLTDLHNLATRKGQVEPFQYALQKLRQAHTAKKSFLWRLDKAKL